MTWIIKTKYCIIWFQQLKGKTNIFYLLTVIISNTKNSNYSLEYINEIFEMFQKLILLILNFIF